MLSPKTQAEVKSSNGDFPVPNDVQNSFADTINLIVEQAVCKVTAKGAEVGVLPYAPFAINFTQEIEGKMHDCSCIIDLGTVKVREFVARAK